jgi:hypothetical protein
MNKVDDNKIRALIHRVGLNNRLPDDEVRKILESQFRFTYEQIRKISFEDLSSEEIDKLKTNFLYKHIGKLYTNADVIRRQKWKDNIIKRIKEDGRTNEHQPGRGDED